MRLLLEWAWGHPHPGPLPPEHIPIGWNHPIGSNARSNNEVEHYFRAKWLGKCSSGRGRDGSVGLFGGLLVEGGVVGVAVGVAAVPGFFLVGVEGFVLLEAGD